MSLLHHEKNCFDSIRHIAALLVLYSHHYALHGQKEPTLPRWDTLGFLAVAIFFAISGYFMPTSRLASTGFLDFMTKRCRRIFPALVVCSFLMVFGIGTVFTQQPIGAYLSDIHQFRNFISFSLFLGEPIPTVFSDFIVKNAINGSLWSLPVEFAWYIILGAALSFSRSWKAVATLLIFSVFLVIYNQASRFDHAFWGVPLSQLGLFGVSFCAGGLLGSTQDAWRSHKLSLSVAAILCLYIIRGRPDVQVAGTISIAILTIIVGSSFKDRIIKGRFDISYGIYIYAFPIQQIVINRLTSDFYLSLSISFALTIGAGALSYIYVERRFLKAKPNTSSIATPSDGTHQRLVVRPSC